MFLLYLILNPHSLESQVHTYHFTGNKEEIINSILSLLFGKDFYREVSLYSNFLNDSQPENYRKKIKTVLDIMQKENLILIRDKNPEAGKQPLNNNTASTLTDLPSDSARVHLRQHGKDVLSMGGFKYSSLKKGEINENMGVSIPFSSKLIIILILIAAITYII